MSTLRGKRVVVMIDQATRDGFSQLLVVHYLRRLGVRVAICNQRTIGPVCERFRPHVVFASWVGGGMLSFLKTLPRATQIVLVDQEGGRLGEKAFKRSFQGVSDDKAQLAKLCSRVFVWGALPAQWLAELGIVSEDRIVVTGSPRLDPYLVPVPPARSGRYIGVTLRGDAITSLPLRFMENIYLYASADPKEWISVGYPRHAQHEDRLWHIGAATRHMFKLMIALSKRTAARIVVRPGPWEQAGLYAFLRRYLPNVSVEPGMSQPEYVRNAFVVLDEASSLGLEAMIAGVPVLTTQGLIPRLAEHIGGEDVGLFNAPYKAAYWAPASVEEAVEYVLRAERGELPASPNPGLLADYLRDYQGWPRAVPSSFQMADAIVKLLQAPAGRAVAASQSSEDVKIPFHRAVLSGFEEQRPVEAQRVSSWVYRRVPGSVIALKAKLLWWMLTSHDREHLRKYHYVSLLYPHRGEVMGTFKRLWEASVQRGAANGV